MNTINFDNNINMNTKNQLLYIISHNGHCALGVSCSSGCVLYYDCRDESKDRSFQTRKEDAVKHYIKYFPITDILEFLL